MKLYQVDAFTSEKFSGNPAGVCLVEDFPDRVMMQNIASEMNLSETAFVKHITETIYKILFFTPTEEIALCGHATLSSAHVLFSTWIVSKDATIEFQATKDTLKVSSSERWYTMNFPLRSFSAINDIQEANNITNISGILEVYDTSKKWKILVIDSIDDLKNLEPNFSSMKGTEYGNIVVTCAWDKNYDYYMRCFVTDCGINEDPVTGSIECVLAPFWAERLWKDSFKSYQCSKRGGEKHIELLPDRVNITGNAVTVFETEI